jgi:hybrid cluster-associated redox disulfide protein
MTITKDMTIYEILKLDSGVAPVFYGFGMHCLGCPISSGETLEQAAAAHGIDVDVILEELNNYFEDKELDDDEE